MLYPQTFTEADHVLTLLRNDASKVTAELSAAHSAHDKLPAIVDALTGLCLVDAEAPTRLANIAAALEGPQSASSNSRAEDLSGMTTEGLLVLATITEIGHTAIQARYESVVEEIARRRTETRAYGPGSRKLEAAHAHHASNVRLNVFTD